MNARSGKRSVALRPVWGRALVRAATTLWFPLVVACGGDELGLGTAPTDQLQCDLDPMYLSDGGVGRDGIPALTDPGVVDVSPIVPENSYARDEDRIIAVKLSTGWLAIPHNIMWVHEIVNLSDGLAVTYCPLTGSALAFSRAEIGGAELGVSGLLYQANLIMYDRNQPNESLWPQMLGQARCGPRTGTGLTRLPVVEMTLGGWKELHPDGKMVALGGGLDDWGRYVRNPYGADYEDPDNGDFLGYAISLDDTRRPPKERVFGFPDDGSGTGATAYPFEAMALVGDYAAFPLEYAGESAVVLWDAARRSAAAFRREVGVEPTTFTVVEDGFFDSATETVWSVDGTPLRGSLAGTGRRLRQIAEPYVAFWGAWAAFHPGTRIAP